MERIAVDRFVAKEAQFSESIKILRTNLLFSGADVQIVGLTSCNASEGKSFISFQLAASLGQTGKRVLLLDADLRNSTLPYRLKMHSKVNGLSHYLTGMANIEELIYSTDVPNLYIMFSGIRVPNAVELLGSNRLKKLIPALREAFDYVIVDTASLGLEIDSAVIAPELDGMVIVMDSTNNSYKQERRIKQQLEKTGSKILGVVLNRMEPVGKGKKCGGYGYGERVK